MGFWIEDEERLRGGKSKAWKRELEDTGKERSAGERGFDGEGGALPPWEVGFLLHCCFHVLTSDRHSGSK